SPREGRARVEAAPGSPRQSRRSTGGVRCTGRTRSGARQPRSRRPETARRPSSRRARSGAAASRSPSRESLQAVVEPSEHAVPEDPDVAGRRPELAGDLLRAPVQIEGERDDGPVPAGQTLETVSEPIPVEERAVGRIRSRLEVLSELGEKSRTPLLAPAL